MAMMTRRPGGDHARGGREPLCVSSPWGTGSDPDSLGIATPIDAMLAEFRTRWERGEAPTIEDYLARLGPDASSDAVELIYQAYYLAESSGLDPDPAEYIDRFPAQGDSLERLFRLQGALDAPQLQPWAAPAKLPEVLDEIGPFRLLRKLGEGGFARVFLAEQSDLDGRLVVVKVSNRITPEPQLLARARHTHIVEVLWHSPIDDGALQLICMPFLGGATLAAVLDDRKRRGRGGRPGSGRELLSDLDRVSAPEYPAADNGRPARAKIALLSHPKAMSWIVARLAGALDYAYGRGVLHGDVKPSNILLTANGEPMLLDFNLAVGWRSHDGDDLPGDAGGTIAYMAPERLWAIAHPGATASPTAADRHRADLFAMGMVLLEALAGRTPDRPGGAPRPARGLAAAFATSRRQGAGTLIRSCGVAIAPGLRSIVTRCLATDPADRYQRASELAEDLDRWCSDRPLRFAREPHCWSGLSRWVRRRRAAVAAAFLAMAVGAVSTLAAWDAARLPAREKARAKLSQLWDDGESDVFRFRRFGRWRHVELESPEETSRHLAYYKVLDATDWRTSDEYRSLPEAERPELEIWLLEQALRLGRATRERPDSPDDWRRGLKALDRVVALRALGPLETQRRLLRRRLGLPEPSSTDTPAAPVGGPPPRWMEEYLLGVEAEPERAQDALAHYREVLREYPGSFWGHYRAAAVAHRLGDPAAAADHLEACIARRPENPALRSQLAGCLYDLHRFDEALEQCDRALELDRDHAESYRTRAFIRGRLGQVDGVKADVRRFEVLTRHRGKVPLWGLRIDLGFARRPGEAPDRDIADGDLPRRLLAADPEDVDLRTALALQSLKAGDREAALAGLDEVLETNPDHLRARYLRAGLLLKIRRDKAEGDLSYLLGHPRFEEMVRESDVTLHAFHYDSWLLLQGHETGKALQVALRGLAYADRFKKMQGEAHYALACIHAVAGRSDPDQLPLVAAHLRDAFRHHPKFLREWFGPDPTFDDDRGEIEGMVKDLIADGR